MASSTRAWDCSHEQSHRIKREHYQNLIGRQILASHWDKMEGKALPIFVLSGRDLDGHAATAAVRADPEGNAPGHLDHHL